MIRLKNEKQINAIRTSCKALSSMYRELLPMVKPGVETIEIDRWVHNWIKKAGGKPAFLGYGPRKNPFPNSICISINEEVIHGIPSRRKIANGDLVSLDCGIDLDGYISDQAITVEAGKVSPEAHRLNEVTRECLYAGIKAAKAGDRLLQIARAVQGHALSHGYGVVHQFCGHGVGLEVHEDPQVTNVPHGPNPKLAGGMVIAIEPMINLGTGDVEILEDDWTVVTADQKLSSHWEHTIAIFPDHTEILTE
ncbi:type I methionyl aminopeptidase [Leadbettera azotonutricia]|uniref:Methionine aminopeptidase n=1 Tax=Leadbettera azotonutricia (strain ATCC BAA-888 / DSM 13862 / ZAS-9) TaxID=545695 RepID=F5Y7U8_LEAAZ|nr:type I methionyl aminopeptidase [Leadbettera azotonutricia]AEF82687.1 methionine aminopeptidase, type I [Leadbettera azotonutricia ZAS-9]